MLELCQKSQLRYCSNFQTAALETLEPRLLMAAAPAQIESDATYIIGKNVNAEIKGWTFEDTDGDIVTPVLSSKNGWVELVFAGEALSNVILHDTTASDSFSLKVKRAKGMTAEDSDGLVWLSSVVTEDSGSLSSLDLTAVQWNGSATVDLQGTLKALKLGDVPGESKFLIDGVTMDKLVVTAGDVGQNVTLEFGGVISQLTVRSWGDNGQIDAYGLGAVTATGSKVIDGETPGGFGAYLDIGSGGVKSIAVSKGDLTGDITTTGAIGPITVTGVAYWDADNEMGWVIGGSLQAHIYAGQVKGKSIGNITLTGGGFCNQDYFLDVMATGDIGNILVKPLKYLSEIEQQEVLDRYGEPKYDRNDEPIYKSIKVIKQQGGGISVQLDTEGKLGNLTAVGANLSGWVHAAKGMGNIVAQTIVERESGKYSGIPYTFDGNGILVSNLTAELTAEAGPKGVAIASISVLGGNWTREAGWMTGGAAVTGSIGKIVTQCYAVVNDPYAFPENGSWEFLGGGVQVEVIADAIGNISIGGGKWEGSMVAMTGGIGKIDVLAGTMSVNLTAYSSIGNITLKNVAINATCWVDRWSDEGEVYYDIGSTEGYVVGGDLDIGIYLGYKSNIDSSYIEDDDGVIINKNAKLGSINGIGAIVRVGGYVPWDTGKAKITSKALNYIGGYDWDDEKNRFIKRNDEAGGPDCCVIDLINSVEVIG